MLAKLFRRPGKTHKNQAAFLYEEVNTAAREAAFYNIYKIPDSFDGRFEALMLFTFLAMEGVTECCDDPDLVNQALFDAIFRKVDFALRESGVGDLGVPKHMKRMMKGFNGRYNAYKNAVICYDDDASPLQEVLVRNIYGTIEEIDGDTVDKLAEYVAKEHDSMVSKSQSAFQEGEASLFTRHDNPAKAA